MARAQNITTKRNKLITLFIAIIILMVLSIVAFSDFNNMKPSKIKDGLLGFQNTIQKYFGAIAIAITTVIAVILALLFGIPLLALLLGLIGTIALIAYLYRPSSELSIPKSPGL